MISAVINGITPLKIANIGRFVCRHNEQGQAKRRSRYAHHQVPARSNCYVKRVAAQVQGDGYQQGGKDQDAAGRLHQAAQDQQDDVQDEQVHIGTCGDGLHRLVMVSARWVMATSQLKGLDTPMIR